MVAKVDATEDLEFAEEYSVKGYPTLKLFKRGLKAPVDYEGEREVDDMASRLFFFFFFLTFIFIYFF